MRNSGKELDKDDKLRLGTQIKVGNSTKMTN